MEAYSITQKKHIAFLLAAFLGGLVLQAVPEYYLRLYGLSSVIFIWIVMAWALSIRRRINQPRVRTLLTFASVVMCMLFVLRQMRYSFFLYNPFVDSFVRLSYYVPYTFLPLTVFLIGLDTSGLGEKPHMDKLRIFLCSMEGLLCLLVYLNPLHGWLFRSPDAEIDRYTYGFLYYVIILWVVSLSASGIALQIRRGRRSPGLEHSYIPVILSLLGVALILWYSLEGGSPTIRGIKLFQIQEIICFMYITVMESLIEIGLISSNSGYEGLFCRSNMDAVILDSSGKEVYTSGKYKPFTEEDLPNIRKSAVSGGVIVWTEDYSAIDRLNAEIRSATEEIEDENDLFREEGEIREERIRYETKNRLYDKIADKVRSQTKLLRTILKEAPEADEERFRERLLYATLLGAYIKRCGNLMLITDENREVSSEELSLSVRESMEYLRLSGCSCEVMEEGALSLPGELLILAFELYERVLETAYPAFHTISVELRAKTSFEMLICLDSPGLPLSADWKQDEIRRLGASLSLRYEDETAYIRLRAGEAAL